MILVYNGSDERKSGIMEFKDRLKSLRSKKNISQQQLADELHISRSVIAKWETGIALPNDEYLCELAKYFDIKKEELIDNYKTETVIVNKSKSISNLKKIIICLSSVFVFIIVCIVACIILTNKDKTYNLSDDINNIGKNYDIIILDNDDDYLFSFDKDVLNDIHKRIIDDLSSIKYHDKASKCFDKNYSICLRGINEIIINESYISINNTIYYIDNSKDSKIIKELIDLLNLNNQYEFIYDKSEDAYSIKSINDKNVEEVVIPSELNGKQVKKILHSAFKGLNNVKKIKVPNSIEIIEDYAFSDCIVLEELYLPSSIRRIGFGIISNCNRIRNLEIPFVGEALWNDQVFCFGYLFSTEGILSNDLVPKSLKSVSILNEDKIEDNQFKGCKYIETFTIGSRTADIGKNAFEGCIGLKTLKILPNSILSCIDENAFLNTDIDDLYYAPGVERWLNITFMGAFSNPFDYDIENNGVDDFLKNDYNRFLVLEDGEYYEVRNIVIPDRIYEIKDYQFVGFSGLESIEFKNTITFRRIGAKAFANTSLSTLYLPESLTFIEPYAFYNCNRLSTIDLPYNLNIIESYAFAECCGLVEVEFNENIEAIYPYAFSGCYNLREFIVPDSCISIGEGVLKGCYCIERLVIPFLVGRTNNVNGDYINDKFASAIFGGTSSNSNHTMMPKSLKEFILTNETDIPDYAFKNCSYLEKVFIPLSVEKMGYHVFENCPNLILYYEGDDYPSSWSNEWDFWHCVCFNYNRWWERF